MINLEKCKPLVNSWTVIDTITLERYVSRINFKCFYVRLDNTFGRVMEIYTLEGFEAAIPLALNSTVIAFGSSIKDMEGIEVLALKDCNNQIIYRIK